MKYKHTSERKFQYGLSASRLVDLSLFTFSNYTVLHYKGKRSTNGIRESTAIDTISGNRDLSGMSFLKSHESKRPYAIKANDF